MGKLSEPSKELVSMILNEVGFENRLIAYRLRERTGPMSISLYSFEEIVGLLNDPHPRMDFNHLARWIREVMGDEELAGEIRKINLLLTTLPISAFEKGGFGELSDYPIGNKGG